MNITRVQNMTMTQLFREKTIFTRITSYVVMLSFIATTSFPINTFAIQTSTNELVQESFVLKGTPEQKMNQVLVKLQELADAKKNEINASTTGAWGLLNDLFELFHLPELLVEDIEELRGLSETLDVQYQETIRRFDTIKDHLKAKGLPENILLRHESAVTKYQESQRHLRSNLNSLFKASTLKEQKTSVDSVHDFISKHKNKRTHQKSDPQNLPWGASDPNKTRKPATTTSARIEKTGIADTAKVVMLASNVITPEMLGNPGGPTKQDLAQTTDAVFTAAIKQKAIELNEDPVEIYNWVLNNIEFIPSYGSIQGADYTLQNQKGNAFDTASLLIALLRASNIPARYAYGTVKMPVDKVMNWVGGINVPEAAQQILGQGGIPNQGVISGGKISHIQLEHVWVEAWIDYLPSRGEKHRIGDNWIPLDSSFKQYEFVEETLDLSILDFEGKDLLDSDNFAPSWSPVSVEVNAAIDNLYSALDAHVAINNPTDEVRNLLGEKKLIIQEFKQFAATLPYELVARLNTYSVIPDELRHKFTYTLRSANSGEIINHQMSLPEIAGNQLSIGFKPETPTDKETLESFIPKKTGVTLEELPSSIPGYLVNLSAQLNVSGVPAITTGSLTMGEEVFHGMSIYDPIRGWRSTQVVGVAGEYRAIGFDLQGTSEADVEEVQGDMEVVLENMQEGESLVKHNLVEKITQLGIHYYFSLNDEMSNQISKAAKIVGYRLPSYGYFYTKLEASYYFGVPSSVASAGMALDVPFLRSASYSKDNYHQDWVNYNSREGLRTSYLEGAVLEAMFYSHARQVQAEGVSATNVLLKALSGGQNIHVITSANVSELGAIDIGIGAKQDILNAINAGQEVTVHESPVTIDSWTGSGYIIIDPVTGAGGYLISGGLNGGGIDLYEGELLMLLSLGLDFIPIVSSAKALFEFMTGRDLITGEPVNRALILAAGFAGLVGGAGFVKLVRAVRRGRVHKATQATELQKAVRQSIEDNASSNLKGSLGEAAVRESFPEIGAVKLRYYVDGRLRIADGFNGTKDGLNGTVLTEVKNVIKQGYTKQIKDAVQYTRSKGLDYDMYVRGPDKFGDPITIIKGELKDAITDGRVNLKYIPGTEYIPPVPVP